MLITSLIAFLFSSHRILHNIIIRNWSSNRSLYTCNDNKPQKSYQGKKAERLKMIRKNQDQSNEYQTGLLNTYLIGKDILAEFY